MAKLRLSFPFFQLPSATSGSGSLKSLAQLSEIADAAFLVSGQAAVQSYLESSLAKAGVTLPPAHVLVKTAGEPTAESIGRGAAFLAARPPSAIVAVGGGSVLDWARLSWAVSANRLDLSTGVMAGEPAIERPRLILVPTTCASGAEGATVAVYSDGGRKRPVISPAFLADRVILDGHFLASLDEAAFSASLSDALTHAVESSVSLVPNGLAKALAGAALRSLLEHADGGAPVASRADRLLEASYLAGVAASHTSVGIAHAFAHAMAAEGLSHGRGNAAALSAAIRFNAASPAIDVLHAASGLDGEALLQRVRTITRPAAAAAAALISQVLADDARRATLVAGMLADAALRSNPVRAGADEIGAFLALLEQELPRS